jgi:hypothetical protein
MWLDRWRKGHRGRMLDIIHLNTSNSEPMRPAVSRAAKRSKRHAVEILKSGIVAKTATSAVFNADLAAEIDAIRFLGEIYPEFMVPVLTDGMVSGRRFYLTRRVFGCNLSEIIFNQALPYEFRRTCFLAAFQTIGTIIDRERDFASTVGGGLTSLLAQEWNRVKKVEYVAPLLSQFIVGDGVNTRKTLEDIYLAAIHRAQNTFFIKAKTAHFDFHFGNILLQDHTDRFFCVAPDATVKSLDPLLGLARFITSFWQELATGMAGAMLVRNDGGGCVNYHLADDAHADLLRHIPELMSPSSLLSQLDERDRALLPLFVLYCFLKSIRSSAAKRPLPSGGNIYAAPQEVMAVGCAAFFSEGF